MTEHRSLAPERDLGAARCDVAPLDGVLSTAKAGSPDRRSRTCHDDRGGREGSRGLAISATIRASSRRDAAPSFKRA